MDQRTIKESILQMFKVHLLLPTSSDGVVFRTGIVGTYGNVIMITHYISGKQYTTVYAHLSGINVSTGQHVSKGQVIGRMGGTGAGGKPQFGTHLHFEYHIGPWNQWGTNAVNPLNIVSY